MNRLYTLELAKTIIKKEKEIEYLKNLVEDEKRILKNSKVTIKVRNQQINKLKKELKELMG